jgi:hypothetical protein
MLHWNGTAWSVISDPQPAGTASGDLQELTFATCRSATDCWAVGYYASPGTSDLNQAQHWDGGQWSVVPTPDPAGTASADNRLFAVRCVSHVNCWAVGAANISGQPVFGQILHWNGSAWMVGLGTRTADDCC